MEHIDLIRVDGLVVKYHCECYLNMSLIFQVGKNLHVLSQIEGIDLDLYKETVLPRVLEQV